MTNWQLSAVTFIPEPDSAPLTLVLDRARIHPRNGVSVAIVLGRGPREFAAIIMTSHKPPISIRSGSHNRHPVVNRDLRRPPAQSAGSSPPEVTRRRPWAIHPRIRPSSCIAVLGVARRAWWCRRRIARPAARYWMRRLARRFPEAHLVFLRYWRGSLRTRLRNTPRRTNQLTRFRSRTSSRINPDSFHKHGFRTN